MKCPPRSTGYFSSARPRTEQTVIREALKVTDEPALHSSASQQLTAQSPLDASSQAFFAISHRLSDEHEFFTAVVPSSLPQALMQRSDGAVHVIRYLSLSASSLSFLQSSSLPSQL